MSETEKKFDIVDFRQYLMLCKFTELANLLIAKGIITKQEFNEALQKADRDASEEYRDPAKTHGYFDKVCKQ